jgi:hypothetical protein
MLVVHDVRRAVELQTRAYQLLKWLEGALTSGLIGPEAAHVYTSMIDATRAWVIRHLENLPPSARPAPDDVVAFSKFFATYLTNTFDLEANPGQRLYSPDAHCFCPCCSWMVRVPHLRPKRLQPADKKVAENLKRRFVRSLAQLQGVDLTDQALQWMLAQPELREPIGLCTYAEDLLERIDGVSVGAASLALWRSFAWTIKGSPKKGFVLTPEAIMMAQQTLVQHVSRIEP